MTSWVTVLLFYYVYFSINVLSVFLYLLQTLLINNNSRVSSSNNDIIVNNGIIQPIDTVLLPPMMASESITQVLLRDDSRFKDLFLALLLAGLTDTLDRKLIIMLMLSMSIVIRMMMKMIMLKTNTVKQHNYWWCPVNIFKVRLYSAWKVQISKTMPKCLPVQ